MKTRVLILAASVMAFLCHGQVVDTFELEEYSSLGGAITGPIVYHSPFNPSTSTTTSSTTTTSTLSTTSTSSTTTTSTTSTTIVADLVMWYPFETNENTVAYDMTGHGTGTVSSLTYLTAGKPNPGSYLAPGAGSIVQPAKPRTAFGNGTTDRAFSLTAWVYMNDGDFFPIVTKDQEWEFETDSQGRLQFELKDNTPSQKYRKYTGPDLTSHTGFWMHVAATYNGLGLTNSVKLYTNSMPVSVDWDFQNTYTAMDGDPAQHIQMFEIGSFNADGRIDDIRVYSNVLSQSDIAGIYNISSTTSSTTSTTTTTTSTTTTTTTTTTTSTTTIPATWVLKFDQDPNDLTNLFLNTGTFAQHATNGAGASALTWVAAAGGISAHVLGDGIADHGRMGFNRVYPVTQPLTMAYWFKLQSLQTGFPGVWSAGTAHNTRIYNRVETTATRYHQAHVRTSKSEVRNTPSASGSTNAETNLWHMAAIVVTQTNNYFYFDGQLKSTANTSWTAGAYYMTNTIAGGTVDFGIGGRWAGSSIAEPIHARLDEYRLYENLALNHTNIYKLWDRTKAAHGR